MILREVIAVYSEIVLETQYILGKIQNFWLENQVS